MRWSGGYDLQSWNREAGTYADLGNPAPVAAGSGIDVIVGDVSGLYIAAPHVIGRRLDHHRQSLVRSVGTEESLTRQQCRVRDFGRLRYLIQALRPS